MSNLRRLPHELLLLVFGLSPIVVLAQPPYYTLVAPVLKHPNTSVYSITLNYHEHYLIDLGSPFTWFRCESPHPPVGCAQSECITARNYPSPFCPWPPTGNTYKHNQCYCNVTPVNPITNSCASSQLTYKDLIIYWTHGRHPQVAINFNHLPVSCAPSSLLQSLPPQLIGVAALSWSPIALSRQFTPSYLGVSYVFSLCLPSSSRARGTIFFGDGPYYFPSSSNFDVASVLSYTPLIKSPGPPEYFINISTIFVDTFSMNVGESVKLSTVMPYTVMRSDIYATFFSYFQYIMISTSRLAESVSPFDLCFHISSVKRSRAGLRVPEIKFVLGNGATWMVYGANSMKQVSEDVACLAFVNGGEDAEQAIVLGAYQMENNFLQFDLSQSRLGFSSSLLLHNTSCGSFDFTIRA